MSFCKLPVKHIFAKDLLIRTSGIIQNNKKMLLSFTLINTKYSFNMKSESKY